MKEQSKKLPKTRVLRSKKINVSKELKKIELELKKISASAQENKKVVIEADSADEDEEAQQIQISESDFPEEVSSRGSRLFSAPILLSSGQERVENLEEFAAVAPSSRESEDDSPAYAAGKKNYDNANEVGYTAKVDDYSGGKKYSSESPAMASSRITSPFIREDSTTGRREEMSQASGMSARTDFEDRSKLEEFSRMQQKYEVQHQQEEREKKRRG